MAFKPKNQGNGGDYDGPKIDFNAVNSQVKEGSRPARVSIIVELGEQQRDPYTEEYKGSKDQEEAIKAGKATVEEIDGEQVFVKEQTPTDQVAVFADLVNDVVDYGEELGEQPYRIMLNSQFKGDIKGTTFGAVPPKSKGGVWTFHPNSMLTKLAKATGNNQIVSEGDSNMDIEQLLNGSFMATIEVKKSTSKGKEYINVKYKGCAPCPEMPDGSPYPVADLKVEPMVITFDDVTEEQAKFLRYNVKEQIKKALNYPGSQMQKVLEKGSTSTQGEAKNASTASQKATEAPDDDVFADIEDDPFV